MLLLIYFDEMAKKTVLKIQKQLLLLLIVKAWEQKGLGHRIQKQLLLLLIAWIVNDSGISSRIQKQLLLLLIASAVQSALNDNAFKNNFCYC